MGKAIHSKIADIAKLRFQALPSRPTTVVKAVNIRGTHVLIDAKGRVYTSQASNYSYWTTTNRMAPTVEGLIKMDVLTLEAVAQHKAAEAEEQAAKNRRWCALQVLEGYEDAGLELTPEQLDKLNTAAKG